MAITATVTVRDAEGNVIYTKGSLAISSSNTYFVDANNYPLGLPLSGAHKVEVALTGGQAVTQQTVSIKLLVES
jgi:hypothetical protein